MSWAELLASCAPLLSESQTLALFRAAGVEVDSIQPLWRRLSPRPPQRFSWLLRRGEESQLAAVIVMPAPRAAEVLDKWTRLHPQETAFGPGVRALPNALRFGGNSATGALLFLWPNDRELRDAKHIADLDKLKRLLPEADGAVPAGWRVRGKQSQLRWVRFKPETRAVARFEFGLKNDATGATNQRALYLRLFQDARGARLDALLRHLALHTPTLRAPQACGVLFEGRCQLESVVAGKPLDASRALPRVREMVAAMQLLHDTPCLTQSGVQDRGADLDDVSLLAPELTGLVEEVRAALRDAQQHCTPALVHGDLYLWQFLADEHGVGLIDFERAGPGYMEDDIGLLLAHTTLAYEENADAAASVFRESLLHELGRSPGWFQRAEAAALAALALGPLRRGLPDALQRAEQRLHLALLRLRAFAQPPLHDSAELRVGGLLCDKLHPRLAGLWPGRFVDAAGRSAHGLYDSALKTVRLLEANEDPLSCGGELVAWRPFSRAVLRRTDATGPVFVKRYAGSKAKLARKRHALVREVAARVAGFPEIAATSSGADNELVTTALAGTPLHDLLMRGDSSAALHQTGTQLARFHSSAAPDVPVTARPTTAFLLAVLQQFSPNLVARAERSAANLVAPSDERRFLCHADLHDRNVLVHPSGIGLIDLDMVQPGDPDEDMGNLAAHCVLRALQRGTTAEAGFRDARILLAAWRANGAGTGRESAAAARTFFRLAVLYTLRRRWRPLTPTLLALVDEAGAICP